MKGIVMEFRMSTKEHTYNIEIVKYEAKIIKCRQNIWNLWTKGEKVQI